MCAADLKGTVPLATAYPRRLEAWRADYSPAIYAAQRQSAALRSADGSAPRTAATTIFAFLDGFVSRVVVIKFDKIEGAKQGSMVMVPVAQQFEHREAALIDHNGFTVKETGPHRQAGDCCDALRKPPAKL